MRLRVVVTILALVLGACAMDPQTDQDALQSDGRDIAEAQCASCHAVGPYGDSPAAAAPPFRSLLSRYRADVLEEELIQGIQVAHPMPQFQINPQSADALIAYLRSVQEHPPPADGARN